MLERVHLRFCFRTRVSLKSVFFSILSVGIYNDLQDLV